MYSAIKSPRTRIFIDDALHSKGRPTNDNIEKSALPKSDGPSFHTTAAKVESAPIPQYDQARMMANAIQRDIANAWQWDMRFTAFFVIAIILMNVGLSFVFSTPEHRTASPQELIAQDNDFAPAQELPLEERVLTFRNASDKSSDTPAATPSQDIDLYELNRLAPAAGTVDKDALLPVPSFE